MSIESPENSGQSSSEKLQERLKRKLTEAAEGGNKRAQEELDKLKEREESSQSNISEKEAEELRKEAVRQGWVRPSSEDDNEPDNGETK